MTTRRTGRSLATSRAAVGLGCLALALLTVNLVLVWNVDAAASAGRPPAATLWLLGLAGAPVVGTIVAGRRPDNAYGWLLLSFGITSALLELTELYALFAIEVYGAAGTIGVLGALVSQTLWGATMGHIPILLLMFPDGKLPSPGWRVVRRVLVTVTVTGSVAALFTPGDLGVVPLPNPYAATGAWAGAVTVVLNGSVAIIFLGMFPAAASLFVRRRAAGAQERLQLRWFSWAAAILAVALLAGAFGVLGSDVLTNTILMLALAGLFGAIGIAVLRYRLYDIDRIVSRTVTYALLSAVLLTLYLAAVTFLTALTAPVAGDSPIAVAVATLLAAAAFGPARRRIQTSVDQRFNRARYDAARTAEAYRARLRDQLDLESISRDLVTTARAAVEPVSAVLWLRDVRGARQ